MKRELIDEAVALGRKTRRVFLTTADARGVPHLTVAKKLSVEKDGTVSVAGWFCPGTVANLGANANVGIVVWDDRKDAGYQLLGKNRDLREVAILDGYVPGSEAVGHMPQVEREAIVDVEAILEFKQAPHDDTEE